MKMIKAKVNRIGGVLRAEFPDGTIYECANGYRERILLDDVRQFGDELPSGWHSRAKEQMAKRKRDREKLAIVNSVRDDLGADARDWFTFDLWDGKDETLFDIIVSVLRNRCRDLGDYESIEAADVDGVFPMRIWLNVLPVDSQLWLDGTDSFVAGDRSIDMSWRVDRLKRLASDVWVRVVVSMVP